MRTSHLAALGLTIVASTAVLAQTAPGTLRRESGHLVLEGVPARDAALTERIGRYLNNRQARFLDWMPDGSMLIATRFGDVEQVHRVAAPMGDREQLTFYGDPISDARVPTIASAAGF